MKTLLLCASYCLLLCQSSLALADDPDYQFPDDFAFGAATAAFQIEGGWNEDGKGPSVWDVAMHERPELNEDDNNGDVACDSYHKYKEDVQMLKTLGADHYRFSISWSRILPNGTADQVNQAGIDYYNNLIDELLANGIQPYVTMYHWDLPQALLDEGGWIDRKLADYFVDYARILFENFGDRVKHWMTFNEIISFCVGGYGSATAPPYIADEGHSDYECTHTVLLAHGKTYRLYESEFREKQNGLIGAAINSAWHEPNNTDSESDQQASELWTQLKFGWFVNPMVYGNYPDIMIQLAAEGYFDLPEFTAEEQEMLKGSLDFLGLNHYNSDKIYFNDSATDGDLGVVTYNDPSWPTSSAVSWLTVVPWGLRKLLVWVKDHYDNIPVIVTENGFADSGELEDYDRADYYKSYLYEILKAIYEEGCNVIGYSTWSLMDNLEWNSGFTVRFGLYYVDDDDPERPRTRKLSSYVYSNIIATRRIDFDYYPDWPPTENQRN